MDELQSLLDEVNRLPPGLLAGAGILIAALALAQLASFRIVLVVVAGIFFLSSVAAPESGSTAIQWLYPVQSQRAPLMLLGGTMLFLTIVGHAGRVLGRPWPVQGFLLLVIGMFAGFMRLYHEGPGAGLISVLFAALTILPLLVVVSALVEEREGILTLLRTLVFTNMAWIAGVAVQYQLDPSSLMKGNQARFQGLLTNPQHAAVYCGLIAAVALWLWLNDTRRRYRVLWIAVAVANLLLVIWSGSRTGFGILAIGATVAFYGRLGRTILLAPIAAVLFIIGQALLVAAGVDLSGAERLTSLEDTRSAAWFDLIESFRQAPLLGNGITELNASENSYLYGLAAYGVGMGVLIVLLVGVTALVVLRLIAIRRWCSPQARGIVDLVIAFNGMYFAGAVLEGYLLARVSSTLVLFVVFAAIGSRILRAARTDPAWLMDEEPWDDGEEAWDEATEDPDAGPWDEPLALGPGPGPVTR